MKSHRQNNKNDRQTDGKHECKKDRERKEGRKNAATHTTRKQDTDERPKTAQQKQNKGHKYNRATTAKT